MNAPSAIRAVYTDYRRVKGRKVHQVTFEIPSELWPDAYGFLGEPTIESSDWFGIARLNPGKAAPESDKPKRKLSELPAAQQAALTCQREAFWRFLREERTFDGAMDEESAATYVRLFCNIASRKELTTNPKARERWNLLLSGFEAWMMGVAS